MDLNPPRQADGREELRAASLNQHIQRFILYLLRFQVENSGRKEASYFQGCGETTFRETLFCAEENLNMGTSESKMAVVTTPKPQPGHTVQNRRLAQLCDPRSPSCGIDRTPIQVSGATLSAPEVQESVAGVFIDPRSPTPGIARTPLKDSMKVTVRSLARKLSAFFLNDAGMADSTSTPLPHVSFTKHPSLSSVEQQDELRSTEPLLPAQDSQDPLGGHTVSPSSPVACSPSVGYGSFSSSPFVLVGEAQVDVDAEVTLEEAEEALLLGESPLQRELSLSLLGCRDGVYSPEFYSSAEERPSTPLPPSQDRQHSDHPYALLSLSCDPVKPSSPAQGAVSPPPDTTQPPEQEQVKEEAPVPEQELVQPEQLKLVSPEPVCASSKPCQTLNIQSEVPRRGIMIPRFDTRSPSQAVFKPQWLGVGFGTTGVRSRGVQGRVKGTSSPLSIRKPATDENENKVVRTKQKQRGKALIAEGRSPLQILNQSNSPRDHNTQVKLKVSTPEKQRFGQMDRRALILSLHKENQ